MSPGRVGLLVIAVAMVGILALLKKGGLGVRIRPHSTAGCEIIPGVVGPEDFARVSSRGFLISSTRLFSPATAAPGQLFFYSLPTGRIRNLTPALPFEFKPHGIDAVEIGPEQWRVFVINHRIGRDTVEVFDFTEPSALLTHRETLENAELLINGNDVLAIGPDTFVVSHDHASVHPLAKLFEDATGWGRGYLSLYRNGKFTKLSSSLSYPNGLTKGFKEGEFFVAEMIDKKILRFAFTGAENVALLEEIELPGAPDNVVTDPRSQRLWVASHPRLLDLKAHSEDPTRQRSPSQVFRISARPAGGFEVDERLLDDGRMISAASVAFPAGDYLFLGAIYEEKILRCPLE